MANSPNKQEFPEPVDVQWAKLEGFRRHMRGKGYPVSNPIHGEKWESWSEGWDDALHWLREATGWEAS